MSGTDKGREAGTAVGSPGQQPHGLERQGAPGGACGEVSVHSLSTRHSKDGVAFDGSATQRPPTHAGTKADSGVVSLVHCPGRHGFIIGHGLARHAVCSCSSATFDSARGSSGQQLPQQAKLVMTQSPALRHAIGSAGGGGGGAALDIAQTPARHTACASARTDTSGHGSPLQTGGEQVTPLHHAWSLSKTARDIASTGRGQQPPQQPGKVDSTQSESARQEPGGRGCGSAG